MSRKIYLCLLLTALIVQQGYKTKTQLQRLAEGNVVQNTPISKKSDKKKNNTKKDKKSGAPLKTKQQEIEINKKEEQISLLKFCSSSTLLIRYYFVHDFFKISFETVDNLVTIISAIIIFGFISSQLPKLRDMGNSSFYEIAYLIIIGLMGIIISYFNKSTNADAFISPFMDMFEVLSVMLIMVLIMSKTRFFKNMIDHKARKRDLLACLIMFSFMGIVASTYILLIDNSYGNVRNLIIMIAGLSGGPVIGIPAGIISGGYRFLMNGPTAVPCSIATIICGFLSSAVYVINGKRFLKRFWAVFLMFLFVGFEMLLILWLCPNISIPYVQNLYPLMVFGAVVGMFLFLMIIKENRKPKVDYEELRINELENTLEEYQDKVDQLEEDIEILKKKIE